MLIQVEVGNVGTVYHGDDIEKARFVATFYIHLSRSNTGRAAGESVTTFRDGEIIAEYVGHGEDR